MNMSSTGDAGGGRGRKSDKYQPKSSARRSEIERTKQEQAESSKQRQRQLEATRVTNRARERGNHGRGRGNNQFRGGLSGWRSESRATGFLGEALSNPTEILDLVPESVSELETVSTRRSQAQQDPIPKSAPGNKKKPKNSTAEALSEPRMKEEAPEASNEDGDTKMIDAEIMEQRKGINIDDLAYNNLISDDEERYDNDGKERKALYPVRLKRKPHVERKITIDTTASSKHAEQIRQEAIAKGVSVSDIRMTIDDAGVRLVNTADIENQGKRTKQEDKQQTNADQSVKTEEDIKPRISTGRRSTCTRGSKTREYVELSDDDIPDTLLQESRHQQRKQPLFSKPIIQTPEDHEEWGRHLADVKAIAEELGNDDGNGQNMSKTVASKQKESKSRRDNKVYLLQLPPFMPYLRSPSDVALDEPADRTSTTELHSQSTPGLDKGKTPARSQADNRGTTVKVEDDAREIERNVPSVPESSFNASIKPNYKGPVGTLTVYESGATALDWGGIEFQLERGMGSMLQETLLVDDDLKVANSMSQVVASFIVKPNWDSLLDADS